MSCECSKLKNYTKTHHALCPISPIVSHKSVKSEIEERSRSVKRQKGVASRGEQRGQRKDRKR